MKDGVARTSRLQLVLSKESIGRVEKMKADGEPSASAAIRKALDLYYLLHTTVAEGGRIVLQAKTPEGIRERELLIIE